MKKKILLIIPMIVFIGIFILFRTVFFIGYIPSASMEPTIKEKSIVVGMRLFGELKVGDVIVFEHDDRVMVKRIAAVGGETITEGGEIYVIPETCFFVLGDNKGNSWDSRFWENPFVDRGEIIAKL